jgi:hypothetical protein
MEKIQLGSN